MPKILVADDNTNIQKMVSLALEERGIDVVAVGNGEAAVRRIPDLQPDLVLADIFMPVRNGYEVCEFVKKDERFSHVPVILLVGAFDPLDEKEARRVGADGVLKKPFVPPDPLIAMVVSALEKNPRVAAEMAKAREKAPEPQEQPLPALEMPARAEVKPLPNFPEPSAEEAALVYGFGSGKRGLGNTAEEDQGPVTPKGAEVEEEAEEHGASTHDWRRSAMDFEIPEETSKSTAFALEDDSAGMFPSERDVPPKHVSPKWQAEEIERAISAPAAAIDPTVKASAKATDKDAISSVPAIAPVASFAQTAPSLEEQVLEVEPLDETEFPAPAPAAHWMDAMAGANSEVQAYEADSTPTAKMDLDAALEPASPLQASAQAPVSASHELPQMEMAEASSDEEEFFADDAQSSGDSLPLIAAETNSFGVVDDPALESAGPVPVRGAHSDPEWETEPEAGEPMGKDPALVEPPAVRVTPEPLLVNEDAAGPPQYGKPSEQMGSPLAFLNASSNGGSAASDADVVDERIPTGPPPNREALADIPFLSPPPEILAESAAAMKKSGVGDETVDAVVRKVLERLEPQLHDLLSQSVVKPLVENILQSDLAKKER